MCFRVLFVLAAIGCGDGAHFSRVLPTDTVATNATRTKIGIREIKPTWRFYGTNLSSSEDIWMEAQQAAERECKRVHRDGEGGVEWEEDYYRSGKTFVDANGSVGEESLTIHYNYTDSRFSITYVGEDPAARGLVESLKNVSSTGAYGGTNRETLDIADGVLKGWKVPRL